MKRKVFHSLIDIEREYMPNLFKKRLEKLKEKTDDYDFYKTEKSSLIKIGKRDAKTSL